MQAICNLEFEFFIFKFYKSILVYRALSSAIILNESLPYFFSYLLKNFGSFDVKPFFFLVLSAKDENEVALCVKELNASSFYPSMISLWVTDSFERKDMERDLLTKLIINLCKSRERLIGRVQLLQG